MDQSGRIFMSHDQKNADRFLGFADLYDHARPRVPKYPVNVICRYLGRNPQLVVDMGCGTGLSSEIWQEVSGEVIGIEPSDDMRRIAESKSTVKMHFKKVFPIAPALRTPALTLWYARRRFTGWNRKLRSKRSTVF